MEESNLVRSSKLYMMLAILIRRNKLTAGYILGLGLLGRMYFMTGMHSWHVLICKKIHRTCMDEGIDREGIHQETDEGNDFLHLEDQIKLIYSGQS